MSIVKWGKEILELEGLSDWSIVVRDRKGFEGFVLFDPKEIHLDWDHEVCSLMLHEISHAVRGEGGHVLTKQ